MTSREHWSSRVVNKDCEGDRTVTDCWKKLLLSKNVHTVRLIFLSPRFFLSRWWQTGYYHGVFFFFSFFFSFHFPLSSVLLFVLFCLFETALYFSSSVSVLLLLFSLSLLPSSHFPSLLPFVSSPSSMSFVWRENPV